METAATEAADKEQEETTLTIPMSSCVTTLNRQFEITEAGWIMMGPIYDELFYMDVDETRYYLAESYEVCLSTSSRSISANTISSFCPCDWAIIEPSGPATPEAPQQSSSAKLAPAVNTML